MVDAIEAACAALPHLPATSVALEALDKLLSLGACQRSFLEEKLDVKAAAESPAKQRRITYANTVWDSSSRNEYWGRRWCDAIAADALRLSALHRPHPAPMSFYISGEDLLEVADTTRAGRYETVFEVTDEDSFVAARRLQTQTPSNADISLRPLVLNMANGDWTGGGFLAGADGQEEALCRRSTLFLELSSMEPSPYSFGPSGVVISPDVVVFRGEEPEFEELLQPFHVSIATAAAPLRPDTSTPEAAAAYKVLMGTKIDKLLTACHSFGAKRLVLSAWGCGAFRNSPAIVAQLFHKIFTQQPHVGAFEHVVFAIVDRWPGEEYAESNRHFFEDEFRDLLRKTTGFC